MFSHHEECPECSVKGLDRAGDNLGVWEDGHKFCFSCGYYESNGDSLRLENVSKRLTEKQEKGKVKGATHIPVLPSDFSFDLPEVAIKWLRQYEITDEEIKQHRFGWSNEDHSLVFPVFDSANNLCMAQRRRFIPGRSRYFTSGLPDSVFHILNAGPDDLSICVVEDLISAVKVSRVVPAMPLWGSQISQNRAWHLGSRFENLLVWLDADKTEYAIRKRNSLTPFFNSVRVIITEQDPKCYTTEQIKEILK